MRPFQKTRSIAEAIAAFHRGEAGFGMLPIVWFVPVAALILWLVRALDQAP